ncbi:Sec-independent protein translocase protein TatB [Larsenimonas salina]|uniref:Sec-independent protein translocase protein TatB n=1 Tax=Larsenimonas salina TaxID=1295565 RepID=UPI00207405C1|nr:Sec-independent protein translocase protein TatB [Larsenimonas salina]MCM5704141.1 Sec-independent protein translocase protein TatB [Larsenimonas salina]
MFDVGFFELMVIGVIALLVLGPERLPVAARTAGLWIGRIKRTVSNVQQDISSQLEAEELRRKMKEHEDAFSSSMDGFKRDTEESLGHYQGPSGNSRTTRPSAYSPQPASNAGTEHVDDSSARVSPHSETADTTPSDKPYKDI